MVKIGEISSCVGIVTTTLFWILSMSMKEVSGLGCFVCSSVNGSDPSCEDTFNSTVENYVQMCKAGRKGRGGLFPGTECIKLKAHNNVGAYMIVRACVVDNGDINSETEIGRIDHCGLMDQLEVDGNLYTGCILSCHTDGCNHAVNTRPLTFTLMTSLSLALGAYFGFYFRFL
ncbi:hypothetical protein CAPTEDRAFT_226308 [Capitella teleta]|uniref:Protein quiver n=1 Tax=Capitella teleta TaxID=283909 RepID=R7U7S1_CAPTE|nr:hypothetical protein CAPTEDRAFT_226308 [Capitella teleta]|eukprot:ELU02410.1 hypothetical protein CAPTEDRAFT_226308 [Capitella teleta]